MIRDRESVALERDYWKALLEDIVDLNDLVVQLLPAALMGPVGSTAKLMEMQDALRRMVRLIDGRVTALEKEAA